MIKKLAIATLIAAPLIVDFAARQPLDASAPTGVPAVEQPSNAVAPPQPAVAPQPAIVPRPALSPPALSPPGLSPPAMAGQAGVATLNGIDPRPTLDPAAAIAALPVPGQQAAPPSPPQASADSQAPAAPDAPMTTTKAGPPPLPQQ